MNRLEFNNEKVVRDSFQEIICDLVAEGKERHFVRFDTFIIQKMGYSGEPVTEAIRKKAFSKFSARTNHIAFASQPTMRRWFGLNGYAVPRREQIYEIGFALHLSVDEIEEYFTVGLCGPGVQYNDYHEVIFLYGLENSLSFDAIQEMITEFENSYATDTVFRQTHSTRQLMEQFQLQKSFPKEQFMEWMVSNAEWFKGYSMTTLDYMNTYKSLIIGYIRSDAGERLDSLLEETDFASWVRGRNFLGNKSRAELVRRYISNYERRNQNNISVDLLENIRELNKVAGSELDSNASLLSEMFATVSRSDVLVNMTGKHLSDLFNLPLQKERAIRADKAAQEMERMNPEAACPIWIREFISEYTKGRECPEKVTEAAEWINKFRAEHHRRVRYVQRQDILPLILYVAQRRYLETVTEKNQDYVQKEARNYFVDMANSSLAACGMTAINPSFQLDAILLACFQPEEMYSYTDVLDILGTVPG